MSLMMVLAAVAACSDATVLAPAGEPDLALSVAADPAAQSAKRMVYTFQMERDFACDYCLPGEIRITPSGVAHFSGVKNRYILTGELEGHADIWGGMGEGSVNFNNGKGIGSGDVLVVLTMPAVGTFECRWHARWVDYAPPFTAYLEYGRWFSCRGTGDFEGMQMVSWNDNTKNPGWPRNDAVAEIW